MVKLTLTGIEDQQPGEVVYVNPSAVSHVVPYPQINPGGCYVHLGGGVDGYGYYARESAEQVVWEIEEQTLERGGEPLVTYAPSGSVTITVPQEEA